MEPGQATFEKFHEGLEFKWLTEPSKDRWAAAENAALLRHVLPPDAFLVWHGTDGCGLEIVIGLENAQRAFSRLCQLTQPLTLKDKNNGR